MNIIIITPNLDKNMGALGIYLESKGLKPLLLVTLDSKDNLGYLDLNVNMGLKEEGIPLYILDYENNIQTLEKAILSS